MLAIALLAILAPCLAWGETAASHASSAACTISADDDVGQLHACNSDEDESALLQTAVGLHDLQPKDFRDAVAHAGRGKNITAEIKVLDVGAPRTGTQTMYSALRELGFNPIHSGLYWPQIRPPLCNYTFGDGSFDDFLLAMGNHDSGMDEPFQLIYEEVMDRWPDSKFVLTLRDPEDWYESEYSVTTSSSDNDSFILDFYDEPWWHECWGSAYWGCNFWSDHRDGNASKAQCLKGFEDHYKRVQQVIPPERLLLFEFSDGYEQLAPFLDKEVPRFANGTVKPFPHTDIVGTITKSR